MFESAELGHNIDKATYDKQAPKLRADLLDAQFDVGELKKFPVIILINGFDGAGKGETVNLLNAWMDPRHIQTHAFPPPSDEERERPFMGRFWRALPPKGKPRILFGKWYTDPSVNRGLKQYNSKAQEVVNHVSSDFGKQAAKYPWVIISVALVFGFLLANLLKPNRHYAG